MKRLNLSKWHKWDDRANIKNVGYPGIYAIAITHKRISGCIIKYQDVVYIGMTNSEQGLKGRLNKFNNSIYDKSGHSGGNTVFSDLGHYNKWKNKKLFVSVMPIECDTKRRYVQDLIQMGVVAYLEYRAFARFKELTGSDKPKYNTR